MSQNTSARVFYKYTLMPFAQGQASHQMWVEHIFQCSCFPVLVDVSTVFIIMFIAKTFICIIVDAKTATLLIQRMKPDKSVAPVFVVVQQVFGTTTKEVCNSRFAMSVTRK